MKVKCIKIYAAHWGVMFQKGEFYTVDKIENVTYRMISDHEKYIDSLKSITSLTPELLQEEKKRKEDPLYSYSPELLKLRDDRLEYSRSLKFEVSIPVAYISDNFKSLYRYCMLSKQELQEKYNSTHFDTTVYIFDEYFETIDKIRDKKINNILN